MDNAPEVLRLWARDDKANRKERHDDYEGQVQALFEKHLDMLASGGAAIGAGFFEGGNFWNSMK